MIALLPLIALAAPTPAPTSLDAAPLTSWIEPIATPLSSMTAAAPVQDFPELEYTYVEVNYVWLDSDDLDESIDGWEATGSLELPLNFFAQLTYSQLFGDADLDTYRLGAGWHFGFTQRFDAYGILSFAHAEVDGSGFDEEDDALAGEVGLRAMLTSNLEVNGRLLWPDVEESDTTVGVGARYYFLNRFSVGGRVESADSDPTFAVGVRFEL